MTYEALSSVPLSDDADIVKAFNMYHTGTRDASSVIYPSIAYYLNGLETSIGNLGLTYIAKSPSSAAGNTIQPTNAGYVPLTIKGFTGQTAKMLSFTDSSDIPKAAVYVDGMATLNYLAIGDLTKPTNVALNIAISTNTHGGIVIRGASSQSGDMIQLKDSSANIIGGFHANGKAFSYSTTDAAPVEVVTLTDTQTLTRKTLTAPTVNDSVDNYSMLKAPKERLNIVGTAAGGATSLYVETSSIWTYIDADATSDVTLTVKYNSSTDLSTKMTTGDAITVVVLIRNGTTARKISTLTVDSTLVSVKWMYGATPAGNASATDIYTFNIIKTASGWTAIGSCIKFGY
jgi:hypothetical protein